MNAPDWLAAYAEKLGVAAPTKDELSAVLDLAGVAAHSSQRIAAPVAAWMAGRAGVGLDEAMRLAEQVPTDSPAGESDG
jgi:1,6-anhydro-N-acetylmuramate kinase